MGPGYTFGSVTDKISAIVLAKRTPRGWYLGFGAAFAAGDAAARVAEPSRRQGYRHLGQQPAGRLGVGHHQLRLVDRHRPRGHADLGDPAAAPAEVADVDQPVRRGDDAVRRRVRRASSRSSPGRPWLAYWLLPVSEHDGLWPQFRSPLVWDVFAVSHVLRPSRCCSGTSA